MEKIDNEILDILRSGHCAGETLTFTCQLDRPTYQKLNKVLEALGGKWNRKVKGHIFQGKEASQVLGTVLEAESYVDEKKEFQFFETPSALAETLVETAGVKTGDRVLEPSAGNGRIVQALVDVGAKVWAVELNENCLPQLQAIKGAHVKHGDFLAATFALDWFDCVVMNPPFSRTQDMQHVQRAWTFLKEGGTLVSVMSPHFTFASTKKAVAFREWAEEIGATWEPLPANSFKESGTQVNTVVFTATK